MIVKSGLFTQDREMGYYKKSSLRVMSTPHPCLWELLYPTLFVSYIWLNLDNQRLSGLIWLSSEVSTICIDIL